MPIRFSKLFKNTICVLTWHSIPVSVDVAVAVDDDQAEAEKAEDARRKTTCR